MTEKTQPYRYTALALVHHVRAVLRGLETTIAASDGPRQLARFDTSSLVKEPSSILDKMARRWATADTPNPPVDFQNFTSELDDLGRFRIVANFLSDAQEIATCLAKPYGSRLRSGLSTPQLALRDAFQLKENNFSDSVHQLPGSRRSGERCHKGRFHPKNQAELQIEVQIQTQLQEAWDKKDHFLVYERRRLGQTIDLPSHCEMFAMSELLYIADRTFDRLRLALTRGHTS